MILKQRFTNGKTQFIDISDNFLIVTPASDEWVIDDKVMGKDVHAVIMYTDSTGMYMKEPLYKDFLQWIYSNDGRLFLNLTSPEYGKKVPPQSEEKQRKPTLAELQAMIHKMNYNKFDTGFIVSIYGGELAVYEKEPSFGGIPVTKDEILKMINEI